MLRTVISVQLNGGSGSFSSVVAAGGAVKPGVPTTVTVSAGLYVESTPLSFDSAHTDFDVEFVALGDGLPTITTDFKSPLRINSAKESKIVFRGLKIDSRDELAPAVLILGGQPVFQQCTLQSVHVDGDAEPLIENCSIADSRSNGISICGRAGGRYVGNVIKYCPLYGIMVDSASSKVLIANSQISLVGEGCIAVCGSQSSPLIQQCILEDAKQNISKYGDADESAKNAKPLVVSDQRAYVPSSHSDLRAAVVIANSASPTLQGNTIFRCQSHGVVAIGSWTPAKIVNAWTITLQAVAPTPKKRKGTLSTLVSVSSSMIVAAEGTKSAHFVESQIRDNCGYGVMLLDGVVVESDGDVIERNELGGLHVGARSNLLLKNGSIGGVKSAVSITVSGLGSSCTLNGVHLADSSCGVFVEKDAQADCNNVKVSDGDVGFWASSRASMSVTNSSVTSCQTGGSIEGYAVCRFENTTFELNDVGIRGWSHGIPEVRRCTIRRNRVAVAVTTSAKGDVTTCTIEDSTGDCQISCSHFASTLFDSNYIKNTLGHAVTCRDGGRPCFDNNNFQSSRGTAVVVIGGYCDPTFTSNKFSGCEKPISASDGNIIVVEEHGVGTIARNSFSDARFGAAIVVLRGACPTVASNTISNNRIGILIESGGEGLIEKNEICGNSEANVKIIGHDEIFAVPTLAGNTIRSCAIGIDCCESSNPLLSRNLIALNTVGIRCRRQSSVVAGGNDIVRNQCGMLATGRGTTGTFFGNIFRENTCVGAELAKDTNVTLCENSFVGHFAGNDEFEGASLPDELCSLTKTPTKSKPKIRGLRVSGDCYGTIVSNRFAFNDIGIEFQSDDNHTIVCSNVFSENLCGLWVRTIRKETLPGFPQSPSRAKKIQENPVVVCGGAFTENGIGLAAVGSAHLDLDFCAFHNNRLAGATVTGSAPKTLFSCCVFSHAGLNNLIVKGDPQTADLKAQLSNEENAKRKIETCLFFGVESSVVFQRHASELLLDDSIFVACPLLIQGGAMPLVRGTHFTGSEAVVAISSACASSENVSFVTDPTAVSLLHASGGGKVRNYLPQVSVTKQLFSLERAVIVESQAGGSLLNCFVSFAKCGIVLDGTCESCSVQGTAISRCLNSGVVIGTCGFAGQLRDLTIFRNFAAGIRVIGKCSSSEAISGCKISYHLAECLLDEPTSQQAVVDSVRRISFPDNADDRPFTGIERNPRMNSDTSHPPLYFCPATEGVGVGIVVHESSSATFIRCSVSHSTVANVVVESRNKNKFTECSFHGAEGFGCVVRQNSTSEFFLCHLTSNFYAGVINESGSTAEFTKCNFVANSIGMISSSDSTVCDEGRFVQNKVCGVRCVASSKCLLTRCTFSENIGCGMECRGGSPTVSYSLFEKNGCCGFLATSAGAAPNIDENYFATNPFGLIFRASSKGIIKKNFLSDNRTGILCRMAADIQCNENTFQQNLIGITTEWAATGNFERNLFTEQRERSVSCTQGANPRFAFNIHTRDAPIVVGQQGRGTFTQSTFRFPRKHCFVISTAADPVISYSRFSLLRGSDSDVERATKIQMRAAASMKAPATFEDNPIGLRTTSSKFLRSVSDKSSASTTTFAFPTDEPSAQQPQDTVTSEPQEEVFVSLTRRLSRTKSQKMLRRGSSVAARRSSVVVSKAMAAPLPAASVSGALTQLEADLKDDSGDPSDYDGIPIRCEQGALGMVTNCVFSHNGPASIFCCGPGTLVFIVNNLFFDHRGCAVVLASDGGAIIRQNLFMRNALALQLSHCDKRTRVERCTFYQNLTSVDATEGCCGVLTACRFLDDHLSIDCSDSSETLVNNCEFHRCDYALCGDSNIFLEMINCKVNRINNGCFVFDSTVEAEDLEPERDGSSAASILTERRRKPQSSKMIALTDLEVFGSLESVLVTGANATLKMNRCKIVSTKGSAILLPRIPLSTISRTVLGTTTISDCTIDGANVGVLLASNVRHRLVLQNNAIMFCEIGLESTTYESNSTVAGCSFMLCDIGSSVERGTAMLRNCDISSCRIGVSLSAGDERNPVVCKSQVFDCAEFGFRLCEGACGVISLNDIFECGVCVDFEQDATTELSHCVLSHPTDEPTNLMRVSNAKRKPRIFEETLTLKQRFSPLHRDKTQKQRALEYASKRNEHDVKVSQLSTATSTAEEAIRTFVERFLNGVGMTLAKMQTIPLHLQLDPLPDLLVTPEAPMLEAKALPQRLTSLWKDDASSPSTIENVPADVAAVPQPFSAPRGPASLCLPEPVTSSVVIAEVAHRNPQAANNEPAKLLRLVQHKSKNNDDGSGLQRRLSSVQRSGALISIEDADEDLVAADYELPAFVANRLTSSFPTLSQRYRLEQDFTSIPTMPKTLELFLMQQPQLEKLTHHSTQQLEQFVQFYRSTNILFAEQVMQAFHMADRRRAHALTIDDVTALFTHIIREYQRGSLAADVDERDRAVFDESQYDMRPRALFPNLPGAEQIDDTGHPTLLYDSVRLYVTASAQLCGCKILEEDLSLREFVRLIEFRPNDTEGREKLFYRILRDYFSWMEKLTPAKELSDASVRPVQPAPQLPTRGKRHR